MSGDNSTVQCRYGTYRNCNEFGTGAERKEEPTKS